MWCVGVLLFGNDGVSHLDAPPLTAELLRPPARCAHDFGRAPPARTDGAGLVSRCLRVGGVPCERVVGRGRRGVCVCSCPAPVIPVI